jgi:hypothetical protein
MLRSEAKAERHTESWGKDSSPTPTQVAGLGRLFGLSPEELLMHDLTSRVLIRDRDSKGVRRWRLDGHENRQPVEPRSQA